MTVSRLQGMAGIGVDRMGGLADAARDPNILRLENLDTDLPLPPGVIEATRAQIARDDANSYLPFLGSDDLRAAATAHVNRLAGTAFDWRRSTTIAAGCLSGILNCLLALLEPGDEVVMPDPIYIGLVNRVRLAGGVPVFVPYRLQGDRWRFDREALAAAITPRTKVFLMMSPAMPTGAVLSRDDWHAVGEACRTADAWLLYDAAMERLLFDGAAYVHPASLPALRERTITVGAVSKEYRMIGWRIGWIVAPPALHADIALVSISNVVCPVGIAQHAAAVALRSEPADFARQLATLAGRRDALCAALADLPLLVPDGGWSALLDCRALGLAAEVFAARLLHHGGIAATPMTGWGSARSADYVRFVYANEPVSRFADLRARVGRALAG